MYTNKRWLSLLLALMLVLSALTGCGSGNAVEEQPPVEEPVALDPQAVLLEASTGFMNSIPEDNYMIKPEDAIKLMEDNPGAIFWVDLRSAEDYAKGHVPGAVNIPYGKIGENLASIPMNQQVIFQCVTGQTSAQVTALTRMLGFNSLSMRFGFKLGIEPLGLPADFFETTENPIPEAVQPELDEAGQILWDAVAGYFQPDQTYITKHDALMALIEENPDAIQIVDIRSAEDYAKGHIQGAINIPFKTVGQNYAQLADNKPVYVYCYTGQTAGFTIAMLRVAGYNAISVTRGMTGWADESAMPVVTE